MITLLLLAMLNLPGAGAAPLDPDQYLIKISERLTGKPPTPAEFDQLEARMTKDRCSEVSCLDDFFKDFIQKKLDTPEFYSEASLKVHERFALQTPSVTPFPLDLSISELTNDNSGTENFAVYKILKEGRPVDDLFVSQSVIRGSVEGAAQKFASFIKWDIQTEKPAPEKKLEADAIIGGVNLTETDYTGHPNVAGLLSSQKFLTRYWNTPVNGNRKRAAAIFKIMLCDPMNPALERMTARAREQALAMGVPESKVTKRTIEEIHKNRHGNQKDCAQCHNRLDPLARTMRPLELGISKFASKGRLRFYDAVNTPVDYPAENFHEIISLITKQQKYSDCQLNWLFNWIVGKDVNVHPVRFAEMLEEFEKNGRKLGPTIASLVRSPEFRGVTAKYDTPPSFDRASAVLSNCNECHSNFLKTHGTELKTKLAKIAFKLDLAHDGKKPLMPPSYHYWEPTKQELLEVKKWILEGAPMVVGSRTLSPGEVNAVLGVTK